MSTPISTDLIVANRSTSSYKLPLASTASLLDTDLLLVNRGGIGYRCTYADIKAGRVQATDLLLVNRGGVSYKCPYSDLQAFLSPAQVDTSVTRSIRLSSNDTTYFSRTPSVVGDRKKWTWSGWVKRSTNDGAYLFGAGTVASDVGSLWIDFGITSPDRLAVISQGLTYKVTSSVYRDYSAWYHIVVSMDTANSTAADRIKLYVNGTRVTSFSTSADPVQNAEFPVNNTTAHNIGRYLGNTSWYFDGYMANVHFIDGQALTPLAFAGINATTGQWVPRSFVSGSYGANGFHLTFADSSAVTATALGKDSSPNSNNWTPFNFSIATGLENDSTVDTPTNNGTSTGVGGEVTGNYCVLDRLKSASEHVLTHGGLRITRSGGGGYNTTLGTFGMSSGKWYWEQTLVSFSGSDIQIGIGNRETSLTSFPGATARSYGFSSNDRKWNSGGNSGYTTSWVAGNVIGVAFDADAGTLTLYKNGVSLGVAFTGIPADTYYPAAAAYLTTTVSEMNFGQRAFAFAAPAGYKSLCSNNLPETAVTTTGSFTGNGAADGPVIYLGGVPLAMTINGNPVTFGVHADRLASGFKVITTSGLYNSTGTNNYSVTSVGDKFKHARAQSSP